MIMSTHPYSLFRWEGDIARSLEVCYNGAIGCTYRAWRAERGVRGGREVERLAMRFLFVCRSLI